MPLTKIPKGSTATVRAIAAVPLRQRLYDLGAVPGSVIEHVFSAGVGGSSCYRICGALIALRDTDAAAIDVEYNETGSDCS